MLSKLFIAAIPFFSLLAPVCSTPFASNITVFASMMNDNPYRPKDKKVGNTDTIDPEEIAYDETIRVMSFNIRSDDDPTHAWLDRKTRVASVIRFHHADLIGLQEPCQIQFQDLMKALPEFNSFAGIYNPIFFRKSRFTLKDSGSFFLSPTPDQPSQGWDAKFLRAVSWVKLYDKKRRNEFVFFNTHFDYHGRLARDESALLLTRKVLEIAGNTPYVIAGDFNLFPKLGGGETYELLTRMFSDAQTLAQFPHHGPTGTWSGFKEAGQPGIKPDCIFVGPEIRVYLHGILSDTFDGQFPSDHLPVVADLFLK
jgi:endonuclease/exonuclease/phosphatase family metal-dependent hydrolase